MLIPEEFGIPKDLNVDSIDLPNSCNLDSF